jgi:oxygen-dependent protoporphyrinogen oxidase
MSDPRIAVVGGGIAGLATAWELRDRAEVTVFEPDHIGGKIRTTEFAGRPIDEGPDAFLTRVPGAVVLCEELGLTDELVAPSAGRALVWSPGGLHALPDGLVLGVPTSLRALASSGLLSPAGMARAALDLVLPRSADAPDVSVDDLVGRRFGSEVAARLVEPLLGSIHAAPTAELSTAATAPNLLAAARSSRSLLLGLRKQLSAPGQQAPPPAEGAPLFLTHRDGLERLVERMVQLLRAGGVTFSPDRVDAVEPGAHGVRVGGEPFDGVVLAVPANEAARILRDAAPPALRRIETTDVVLVTLEVPRSALQVRPDVNGILAQRDVDAVMTACSFGTNKWPQWKASEDRVVVRASAGRHGDRRASEMADDALVERLAADLGAALGSRIEPTAHRVSRWPGAFPLYRVGHLDLVAGVESELTTSAPRVALAGASYRGAGIPACITSGRTAAGTVLASVRAASPRPA